MTNENNCFLSPTPLITILRTPDIVEEIRVRNKGRAHIGFQLEVLSTQDIHVSAFGHRLEIGARGPVLLIVSDQNLYPGFSFVMIFPDIAPDVTVSGDGREAGRSRRASTHQIDAVSQLNDLEPCPGRSLGFFVDKSPFLRTEVQRSTRPMQIGVELLEQTLLFCAARAAGANRCRRHAEKDQPRKPGYDGA